jgi:class 3 adenylate cyclase
MSQPPLHYQWQLTLQSSPDALWVYVADTDRLNHDLGHSPITRVDTGDLVNNRKTAQQTIEGFWVQQWTEEPFQWVKPYYNNTHRNYSRGIFDHIYQQLIMTPRDDGGTLLDYQLWIHPRYHILRPLIHRSFSGMDFPGVFRQYDTIIQSQSTLTDSPLINVGDVTFVDGGQARLASLKQALVDAGSTPPIAARLHDYITHADDLSAVSIRPYKLADAWQLPRRDLLDACLIATRVGLLDMRWDLLCPLCRGAKVSVPTLENITRTTHCDVCHIDYNANFEQSVELIFQPSRQIRDLINTEYCVGGPETTPHIDIQQLLQPGESRTVQASISIGRYRARTMTQPGERYLRVQPDANNTLTITAAMLHDQQPDEPHIRPDANITLTNDTDTEQLFVLEHLIWSDQAVTAAEVTTRQVFRDLFSSEALRPHDQIEISNLVFVFTDLRASTQMYREVGDAPAFGLVMNHFDILRDAIREQDGAIVKTIGDAVMAVFRQPEKAVRAMLRAHADLSHPESVGRVLQLRVGIHMGKAIAVTLNDRLDYFGTTINISARLEGQSDGSDIILSDTVHQDPNVQRMLEELADEITVTSYHANLKGFADDDFTLWRIQPHR